MRYINVGNLHGNDRVSIILMDCANQRHLKILGRVHLVTESEHRGLIARLALPHYHAWLTHLLQELPFAGDE